MAKKRIGILTGGGDCPGLNAVIRAAVRTAHEQNFDVVGVQLGFEVPARQWLALWGRLALYRAR